jgi:hypothetical protein
MSLPRTSHTPSHSSSPSKFSSRAVPQPQQTTTSRNPSLLPSPVFNEPHISPSPTNPQGSYEEDPDVIESRAAQSASFQPSFQPLFTLIEDPITREHHHPTVHYIFADDDNDIITEAALRSLADIGSGGGEGGSQEDVQGKHENTDADGGAHLLMKKEGVKEHYIVVDVCPTSNTATSTSAMAPQSAKEPQGTAADTNPIIAFEVTSAYSLSSEWQVLRTSVTQAPTIGDVDDGDGLMLRIEGRGNTPPDTAGKEKEQETLEDMITLLKRGLDDVRLVMESGGRPERGQGVDY